ncbi:Hypothetical predicted protein, partial [Pelobates cultripes]
MTSCPRSLHPAVLETPTAYLAAEFSDNIKEDLKMAETDEPPQHKHTRAQLTNGSARE